MRFLLGFAAGATVAALFARSDQARMLWAVFTEPPNRVDSAAVHRSVI